MRDLREVTELSDYCLQEAKHWREFRWTRWERPHENWTHDHCRFCSACICDHRERFPREKEEHLARGCYRNAYYAQGEADVYIWVCRTCFKRVAAEFGWSVEPGTDYPTVPSFIRPRRESSETRSKSPYDFAETRLR